MSFRISFHEVKDQPDLRLVIAIDGKDEHYMYVRRGEAREQALARLRATCTTASEALLLGALGRAPNLE